MNPAYKPAYTSSVSPYLIVAVFGAEAQRRFPAGDG